MTSLPLSNGVPRTRCAGEAEQQGPGRRLALDAMAGDRVPEERDVDRHVNLGLARLPVETPVERKELIEGRELDLGSRKDREIRQGRAAAGGDRDADRQGQVRRGPGSAVGPPG